MDEHQDHVVGMCRQLFTLSELSRDADVDLAHVIGGAIVDDLIGHTRKLRRLSGHEGFLVLCPTRPNGKPVWETPEALHRKIIASEKAGEYEAARLFTNVLKLYESHDPEKYCFMCLAGLRDDMTPYFTALLIPIDDPHANLLATLKAAVGK